MAEQEQDRSEEATPHKREEARKQGNVARSQDVSAAASLAVLLAVLLMLGGGMVQRLLALLATIWQQAAMVPFSIGGITQYLQSIAQALLWLVLPFFVALMLVAILLGMAQAGVVISTHPLKPDWQRLNPVKGLKKLFSWKLLFEALKSVLKFTLFSAVLYFAIRDVLPGWMALPLLELPAVAQAMGQGVVVVSWRLLLAMLVVALLDVWFVRRTQQKDLRMSRREVREEYKRRDGDPRIKAKLREIRRELLKKSQSLSRVADADVLLVNPQHLALAIQYQRGVQATPLLISKGAGEVALTMRQLARRHGVPILENKPLARALFLAVQIDEPIPEQHFAAVAKALVWAYQQKEARGTAKALTA
ncbi:EscU/YscU/HrcU family type III secretion system export apparatus switch protein [Neisseriaceae bacterium TC5R-5]|nr:EscU/YscU/HrcU family type III secretion system export apparatus switch protein [Neisseriaceae bacterium TC5R-5]